MTTIERTVITVKATIKAPVEKVWNLWTEPIHIIHWNNASNDWHTPRAENDLRVGGKFLSRMEARDGSTGFDFTGEYSKVEQNKCIDYTIADGRKVHTTFDSDVKVTKVTVSFESEQSNPIEMQKAGWQAILDNFKDYTELSGKMEALHFEINIKSDTHNVYSTMLSEKTFSEWTSEFNPSSHFKGSWEKGAKIIFLGTDKEGNMGGMVSKIKENIPGRFISIEYLGIVKNGAEITSGPEAEEWSGVLENYTFTDVKGTTLLKVDIGTNQEFKSYFTETWPKALNRLKLICEKK